MDDTLLAERFEAQRSRLTAVARRILGSSAEADDAVQEAWLRLSRQARTPDAAAIDNLDGWLTTVVSRICLNVLQARRREAPLEWAAPGEDGVSQVPQARSAPGDAAGGAVPEAEALLGDAIGAALLVVLDTLSPAERLAFVLHDLFGVPFEQVAEILDKSPAAARQLASRARRRVQGADHDHDDTPSTDPGAGSPGGASPGSRGDRRKQHEVVEAFLAAAREGEFTRLLELLDPGAVLRLDAAAASMGAQPATGADAVARVFCGRAQAAEVALLDGTAGLVWRQGDTVRVAFRFTLDDAGRVSGIEMVADAEALAGLTIE